MNGIINLDNEQLRMLQGKAETEVVPHLPVKRIQRDPAYHPLKDENYQRMFNFMNVIDRPFVDMRIEEADAPDEELQEGVTNEEKELGVNLELPFELVDMKPEYKEGNGKYESEWQNSDDTSRLIHDFAHRCKPGRFKLADDAG